MPRLRLRNLIIVAVPMLTSCGTYVPEIQDFPGDPGDGQLLVNAVVQSIHCEITNSIANLYGLAKRYNQTELINKLDGWGTQIALTLTTEEKGTLNPTVVWTPPSPPTSIFTLFGGLTLSSDATRVDTLNYYYTIKDLKARGPCRTGVQPAAPVSSPLIQSDLKLGEWLAYTMIPVGTGTITLPESKDTILKQNVISHQVKFEVVTTGTINPAWKLKRFLIDQTGSLATATRDRTHNLLITLGPGDSNGLLGQAANTHLAQEIGIYVTSNKGNTSQ
jgi:hypothetical protein